MFELNLEEHVCFTLVNVLLINVIVEHGVREHGVHVRRGACADCSLRYKREGLSELVFRGAMELERA